MAMLTDGKVAIQLFEREHEDEGWGGTGEMTSTGVDVEIWTDMEIVAFALEVYVGGEWVWIKQELGFTHRVSPGEILSITLGKLTPCASCNRDGGVVPDKPDDHSLGEPEPLDFTEDEALFSEYDAKAGF